MTPATRTLSALSEHAENRWLTVLVDRWSGATLGSPSFSIRGTRGSRSCSLRLICAIIMAQTGTHGERDGECSVGRGGILAQARFEWLRAERSSGGGIDANGLLMLPEATAAQHELLNIPACQTEGAEEGDLTKYFEEFAFALLTVLWELLAGCLGGWCEGALRRTSPRDSILVPPGNRRVEPPSAGFLASSYGMSRRRLASCSTPAVGPTLTFCCARAPGMGGGRGSGRTRSPTEPRAIPRGSPSLRTPPSAARRSEGELRGR